MHLEFTFSTMTCYIAFLFVLLSLIHIIFYKIVITCHRVICFYKQHIQRKFYEQLSVKSLPITRENF